MIRKVINYVVKKMEKPNYIIDSFIVLLVILVVILTDIFVIKIKSSPGELVENISRENEQVQEVAFRQIETNEYVFVPILNFHHIDKAPFNLSKIAKSYYLEPEKFEQILNDLINNDYRPVFVSEIVNYLQKGKLPQEKIMAITFDDGNKDFYTNAWPILQKLKIKSNMYLMAGVEGQNYLNKDQIIELDKSGLVEIGSHTVFHPYLTRLTENEILWELKSSKEILENLLNKKIEILCYPFGLYNDKVKKIAKVVGYQAGLTFDQDTWQDPQDLFELKRISVYPELNVVTFLAKLKENK